MFVGIRLPPVLIDKRRFLVPPRLETDRVNGRGGEKLVSNLFAFGRLNRRHHESSAEKISRGPGHATRSGAADIPCILKPIIANQIVSPTRIGFGASTMNAAAAAAARSSSSFYSRTTTCHFCGCFVFFFIDYHVEKKNTVDFIVANPENM
jgi:hypothetical protein